MDKKLRCFISAPYDTDISYIKNILAENNVDTFDLYDFSVGHSIQQILKRKLRESDFALFIISKDSSNVIYEMGVCEGLGKQHFIILEKDFKVPFYIENKLFIRANLKDRSFLQATIHKVLNTIKSKNKNKRKSPQINKSKEFSHNKNIQEKLLSLQDKIVNLRKSGTGIELEYVVGEVFKTVNLNYVENSSNKDKGVDFALWSDELGKIVGNPIIIEVKYGNLTNMTIQSAELQLKHYIEKSDAKIAILLYLDKGGKRFKIQSSINPLFMAYDVEDFIHDLFNHSFEGVILNQRNKIAHGIE
ncbi:MAG: hypothetical protein NTZ69_02805 [Bacteroidia bacterium]|nr:hypothetical protein [Bacteroidia bacterium]